MRFMILKIRVNKNIAEEWAASIRHLVRKALSNLEPQMTLRLTNNHIM